MLVTKDFWSMPWVKRFMNTGYLQILTLALELPNVIRNTLHKIVPENLSLCHRWRGERNS